MCAGSAARSALSALTERLRDNYPFGHPTYAGQMLKPPHHPYTDLLLSSVPEMDPNWLTTLLEERGVDNVGEAANTGGKK